MTFTKNIAPHVEAELEKSVNAPTRLSAFRHLERAHILGQESTYWHVKAHWYMLVWGIAHRDAREVLGQLIRLTGAALLTTVKQVPMGNTGGSRVSMIEKMPIPVELAEIINQAKEKKVPF